MVDLRVWLKAITLAVACSYATLAAGQQVDPPGGSGEVLSDDPDVLLNRLGTLTADDAEATRLAGEILERWTHSGSPAMDLLLQRGRDAIEAGDYARAVVHLTALTDHAPQFAEGWNQRATAFFLQERYGEAISDIEQVLILEPRHFGALAGLGIMLEQLGDDKGALNAFRAAQDIYPAEANVNRTVERLEQQTGGRAL